MYIEYSQHIFSSDQLLKLWLSSISGLTLCRSKWTSYLHLMPYLSTSETKIEKERRKQKLYSVKQQYFGKYIFLPKTFI